MPKAPPTKLCPKCRIYQCPIDSQQCSRCQREMKWEQEALERGLALDRARRQKKEGPPRAETPCCWVCLTTQHLSSVDPETNVGICFRCKTRQRGTVQTIANTYGQGPRTTVDPNAIY